MNWKSTSKKVSFGIAAIVSLGVLVNTSAMESTFGSDCECLANSTTISHTGVFNSKEHAHCVSNVQGTISWFDWIGGNSPSYQFHFLDLLELLHGDDENSNDQFSQRTGGSV